MKALCPADTGLLGCNELNFVSENSEKMVRLALLLCIANLGCHFEKECVSGVGVQPAHLPLARVSYPEFHVGNVRRGLVVRRDARSDATLDLEVL